jgi:acetylglutamate kinase
MQQLSIIKIGGNVIDDALALQGFLQKVTNLTGLKILVHGGGKIASQLSEQMGITPVMVDGRRVTDDDTIELVTMVYAGLLSKQLVAQLVKLGMKPLGLSGADGNLILACKRPATPVDFGWVGDVTAVDGTALHSLLQLGYLPVFNAITHDGQGNLLNTNADTIACELAKAMAPHYKVRLLYCFEKPGVMRNIDDLASLVPVLGTALYQQLLAEGVIAAGMKPKLKNCFDALQAGVEEVRILHADYLLKPEQQSTHIVL